MKGAIESAALKGDCEIRLLTCCWARSRRVLNAALCLEWRTEPHGGCACRAGRVRWVSVGARLADSIRQPSRSPAPPPLRAQSGSSIPLIASFALAVSVCASLCASRGALARPLVTDVERRPRHSTDRLLPLDGVEASVRVRLAHLSAGPGSSYTRPSLISWCLTVSVLARYLPRIVGLSPAR